MSADTSQTSPSDRPEWATEPEEEYVARTDEYLDEPEPQTTPSGDTVRADRRDAAVGHQPDRPPTPDEEERAEQLELDPEVAESYREAAERGAHAKGEGRI